MRRAVKILAIILLIFVCGGIALCFATPFLLAGGVALFASCVKASRNSLSYDLNEDGQSYAVVLVGSELDVVEIPERYNGLPVTRIAAEAFTYQPWMMERSGLTLEKLTLPATIDVVEKSAFYSSGSIGAIYYGGTLADWYAISFGCSPLGGSTDLYIGGQLLDEFAVPEGATELGAYLFAGYSRFHGIVVPEGVTKVGRYAFRRCAALGEVALPQSLRSIGAGAFADCGGLEIRYGGAASEWEKIEKGEDWRANTEIAVHCADGVIAP